MAIRSTHPSETAERHLVTAVPTAGPDERAAEVLAHMLGQSFDSVEIVCVIDTEKVLVGIVRLQDLLAAPPETRLEQVMLTQPPAVLPGFDQERAAGLAVRHALAALPVVDGGGQLIGVIPPQALLAILRHEHVEDLHRLAGIRRETNHARHALEEPPRRRVHDRLPWLLVGLCGSMLATFVVSRFEHVLNRQVAVGFFVPGIVYIADAIGTQTEAIAVRGLSLTTAPFQRLLLGELWTGGLIGLALAGLAVPMVLVAFNDLALALSVGVAIITAGTAATTIGLMLPWLFSRFGADPALGSGPVATIIQDVLSLLIYFQVVQLLLR